jgi:hypothetical protein
LKIAYMGLVFMAYLSQLVSLMIGAFRAITYNFGAIDALARYLYMFF